MATESTEQTNEELILGFLADSGDDYTSGEALSNKLGLSRAAVWKHVESLREKGYRIDAAPARGYRLVEIPDRLSALELSPLLNTHDIGRVIHHHAECASTNELAFELAREGSFHGEVVIAEQQTAGRGRRGRSWVSPAGLNLYCSIILRPELPPQRAPELTLVTAVALAQTIHEAGIEAQIKWPNDVHVGGKKVGGVLTELSAEPERVHFVIVGVGVNINAQPSDFPPDVAPLATSLSTVRGDRVPRALFTAAFFTCLEEWVDRHADEGFAPVRAEWKRLSSTLGQQVLVKTERSELQGFAEDIDDDGALLVKLHDGRLERVLAGDVEQVRPKLR